MSAPPPAVLLAFGLLGDPVRLPGGQERSWRVGHAVLKPLDLSREALVWQADVLARLSGRSDLRVSAPLRTGDGRLVAHGWTAWRYEPGVHVPRRWADIVDAGRRLHTALANEPRPAFLDQRDDRWAVADRVAWGELPPPPGPQHLDRLQKAMRPAAGRDQILHGDLTRNVLFADGLPPLVIDLSPYWRPPGYAHAIVVTDALLHEGACEADVAHLVIEPQLLLRALVLRTLSDVDPGRLDVAIDVAVRLAGG